MNRHVDVLAIESGQAAGRDIKIKNYGRRKSDSACSETKRQKKFARDTGISCSKPVREVFEELMAHHACTQIELKRAYDYAPPRWDHKSNRLDVDMPFFKVIVEGWLYAAGLCLLLYFAAHSVLPGNTVFDVLICVAAAAVCIWFAGARLSKPRRAALRIQALLNQVTLDVTRPHH